MTKRLFTFGCSFTQYHWPTWADILGREFDYYENWGQIGVGNEYILHSVIECNKRNKFNSNDTVLIMWSSVNRVDFYKDNKWVTHGNIFTAPGFSKEYILKYYDKRGFYLKSLSFIEAAASLLKLHKVEYDFMQMIPLSTDLDDVTELFSDTIVDIKESMYDPDNLQDNNFTEVDDARYIETTIRWKYNEVSGTDWPLVEDYINNTYKNVSNAILAEIEGFIRPIHFDLPSVDTHMGPKLHLKYLDKVLSDYYISKETRNWINNYKIGDPFDSHLPRERL